MNSNLIFFPVIVQIFLTLFLYILLTLRKIRALKSGSVNESRRGLFDDAWPIEVIAVNNCIRNQFEVPVLFYVLCMLLFMLNAVSVLSLSVACLFVLSRVVHAYIHTGSNDVPVRRRVFMISTVLVLIMSVLVTSAIFSLV
ncbi:MAPEG family protein [Zhongshania sp. BJYM1]|uniref:MAPEG family protein n=1 Tax=Zhongshania aquatica TaxID=2965069 RepID=UPI0022B53EB3|nr:MAPEG family protein [Marortus sp. BJYM1]